MFANLTTQLAREQQRRMLAEASRQRRHQHEHPAPEIPGADTRITRSLAARAWTSAAALQAPRAS